VLVDAWQLLCPANGCRRLRVLPPTSVTLSPDRQSEAQAQAAAEFASEPGSIREASAMAFGLQQVDNNMATLPRPGAYPRPTLRPSTLPAGRSWLTGGRAPEIGELLGVQQLGGACQGFGVAR
jgi:hypothetical protein